MKGMKGSCSPSVTLICVLGRHASRLMVCIIGLRSNMRYSCQSAEVSIWSPQVSGFALFFCEDYKLCTMRFGTVTPVQAVSMMLSNILLQRGPAGDGARPICKCCVPEHPVHLWPWPFGCQIESVVEIAPRRKKADVLRAPIMLCLLHAGNALELQSSTLPGVFRSAKALLAAALQELCCSLSHQRVHLVPQTCALLLLRRAGQCCHSSGSFLKHRQRPQFSEQHSCRLHLLHVSSCASSAWRSNIMHQHL